MPRYLKKSAAAVVLVLSVLISKAGAFSCKMKCTKALGADAQIVLTHYLEGPMRIAIQDFKPDSFHISKEDQTLVNCFSCSFTDIKNFLCSLLSKQDSDYKPGRIKTLVNLFKHKEAKGFDYFSEKEKVSEYAKYCSKEIYKSDKIDVNMEKKVKFFAQEINRVAK
jgi:hypothetical protein